jgi:hypothetical protein
MREPRASALKRSEILQTPRRNVAIGVCRHLAQRRSGAEFQKGRCSALHAALQAVSPLHRLRYLSREIVQTCLGTDDRGAIYPAPAAGRAFEAPDALAKLLDPGTDNGWAHVGNGLGE